MILIYIFYNRREGGASPSSLSLMFLYLLEYILAAGSTTAVCNSLFLFDLLNLSLMDLIWQNDISRLTNKLLQVLYMIDLTSYQLILLWEIQEHQELQQ